MSGCKGIPFAGTKALILAGGRSRRMGRDKARLRLPSGRTFLEKLRDELSGLVDAVWISGPYPELGGFADDTPGQGPLGGIAPATARLGDGARLLVIPVDMPFLTARWLAPLVESAPAHYRDHELPACFVVDSALRAQLAARLSARGERSARSVGSLLQATRALALDAIGAEIAMRNLNSPDDLARAGL